MPDEPLDQRLQLVISRGQIGAVDEWRRQQPDLPSRSEAIRRLIEAGLRAPEKIPIRGQKPEPSAGGDGNEVNEGGSEKPERQASAVRPVSKSDQLRALREQAGR
jgi:hypothetical protein